MVALDMGELVRQAEKEGVTLAEMISRTMTPSQMDELQSGLCTELASNYCTIEGFMQDVEVTSLEELLGSDQFGSGNSAVINGRLVMDVSDDLA